MSSSHEHFDTIVIGSGMGGLTVASLAAQLASHRVLVLERHFKLGGFTHTFARGRFEWDVGLHYVPSLGEGQPMRHLFDKVTQGAVTWNAMPEVFEKFVYPGLVFAQRTGEARFQSDLLREFPGDGESIRAYFRDIAAVARWIGLWTTEGLFLPKGPRLISLLPFRGRRLAFLTTGDYLAKHVPNSRLRALLTSQWLDYGLPPSQSAFWIHALIVHSYLSGGYYPVGGAGTIAAGVRKIVQKAGGVCLVNHDVQEILMEGGSAVGVRVVETRGAKREEKRFFAPRVVSDAGAVTTYQRFLGGRFPVGTQAEALASSAAHVNLYIGFKRDPRELGFRGENHWIFSSWDPEEMATHAAEVLNGRPSGCYLSFPSLKTGSTSKGPTAEIIAIVPSELFQPWKEELWRRRSPDYERLKAVITGGLLELVEKQYPGFRDAIAFTELSTPLSTEHFTGHPGGQIYGLPATPARFRLGGLGPCTPVRGLYLTGVDIYCLGILGAFWGGIWTTRCLVGLPKILRFMRS